MEFGDIIFQPGGDTITIDASDGGSAGPQVEKGLLFSGGQSGLLTITLSEEAEVEINYPDSITLEHENDGPDLIIDDIQDFSEYGNSVLDHPGNNQEVEVNIGGRLTVNSGSAEGSYQGQGTINIQITYL